MTRVFEQLDGSTSQLEGSARVCVTSECRLEKQFTAIKKTRVRFLSTLKRWGLSSSVESRFIFRHGSRPSCCAVCERRIFDQISHYCDLRSWLVYKTMSIDQSG